MPCVANDSPQQDDIVLQIILRYFNGSLSVNSIEHDTYDKEVYIPHIPIKSEEKFETELLCDTHQHKVII